MNELFLHIWPSAKKGTEKDYIQLNINTIFLKHEVITLLSHTRIGNLTINKDRNKSLSRSVPSTVKKKKLIPVSKDIDDGMSFHAMLSVQNANLVERLFHYFCILYIKYDEISFYTQKEIFSGTGR